MQQGVQRPPMPNMHGGTQHTGYGGGQVQHGSWDNGRQSMNGTPSGPRGGRRGYGPSGNNFQQGRDRFPSLRSLKFQSFFTP